MRFLVVALAALALAPAAMAWTQVGSGVSNSADPALLGGLVAYSTGSALKVVRGGTTATVRTGAFVGDPRLVRRPDGTILLFVGTELGVVSYSSANGGVSWSG